MLGTIVDPISGASHDRRRLRDSLLAVQVPEMEQIPHRVVADDFLRCRVNFHVRPQTESGERRNARVSQKQLAPSINNCHLRP